MRTRDKKIGELRGWDWLKLALACVPFLAFGLVLGACGDSSSPEGDSGIVSNVNDYTSVESVYDPVTGRDFRCIYYFAYKKGGVWCYEVTSTP